MQRWYWWGVGLAGLALAGVLVLIWNDQHTPEAAEDEAVAAFLARHWRFPIPLQGAPPENFSPLEASLQPKDCGVCHPQQYQDWQQSIHSRSMGPGVYGQLLDMDAATVAVCSTCHTPLSEQLPQLLQGETYQPNDAFDPDLQQAGLVCAACHVRQHQRFGPPRRAELPPIPPDTTLPHGGFTATKAFLRSEFCQGCHQFGPDDFALNGKLIENTYQEWRQSPYAAQGTQCQDCHMPDRRHLWRGIHDPDMVKQAMTVTLTPTAPSYAPGEQVEIDITVTNSGAGHYLPTYVTPKIFVRAHLLDTTGAIITDTAQQAVIGREVTLDLSQELYDTRIPPLQSQSFTYSQRLPLAAEALRVQIVVHPDHFYQRFFTAVLADGGGGKGRSYLQRALQHTSASSFTVFERRLPLRAQAPAQGPKSP